MSVKTKRATFMLHRPSDSKSRAPRPEPFIHLVMMRMMVRMRMMMMMKGMMLMLLNIGYKTAVTIADGSQYDEKLCDDDDDNDDDGDDHAHTGWCSSPAANQLL